MGKIESRGKRCEWRSTNIWAAGQQRRGSNNSSQLKSPHTCTLICAPFCVFRISVKDLPFLLRGQFHYQNVRLYALNISPCLSHFPVIQNHFPSTCSFLPVLKREKKKKNSNKQINLFLIGIPFVYFHLQPKFFKRISSFIVLKFFLFSSLLSRFKMQLLYPPLL